MASRTNPLKLRHERIRKKVSGTGTRPRLSVHFSGQHIYAQVVNDEERRTVASVSTTEEVFRSDASSRPNVQTALKVGKLVAERAKEANVSAVVFDRGGYIYHGKVKALADAAREGGLDF
jgi:large subunit ribosomal protein L18